MGSPGDILSEHTFYFRCHYDSDFLSLFSNEAHLLLSRLPVTSCMDIKIIGWISGVVSEGEIE